jgi:hypothetical protein
MVVIVERSPGCAERCNCATAVRSSAEISAFAYIMDAVLVWWLYHPKHVAGAEMLCANLESVYSFLHLSWDSFINNRIDQLLRGMALLLLLLFSLTYVDVERLRFEIWTIPSYSFQRVVGGAVGFSPFIFALAIFCYIEKWDMHPSICRRYLSLTGSSLCHCFSVYIYIFG